MKIIKSKLKIVSILFSDKNDIIGFYPTRLLSIKNINKIIRGLKQLKDEKEIIYN